MGMCVRANISATRGGSWVTRTIEHSSGKSDCGIDALGVARDTGRESGIQVPNESRRRDQRRVRLSGGQVDARGRTREVGEVEDLGGMAADGDGRELARGERGGDGAVGTANAVATVAGDDGRENCVDAWGDRTCHGLSVPIMDKEGGNHVLGDSGRDSRGWRTS